LTESSGFGTIFLSGSVRAEGDAVQNEHTTVTQIDGALKRFSALNADITVTEMRVFLAVAKEEGISQKEIALKTGASESRVCAELARLAGYQVGGFLFRGPDPIKALVDLRPDSRDRRLKQAWLTPAGVDFVRSLVPALNLMSETSFCSAQIAKDAG
jgi:DNA-binding MarR family transcriptional regulator